MQRHGVRRPAAGLGRLTGLFGQLVRETDAAVGMLYALPPGEGVLEIVALSGMSRRIAAPWARMGVDARHRWQMPYGSGVWCGWAARTRWPGVIPGSV